GVGHRAAAQALGGGGDLLGRGLVGERVDLARLADAPVLAVAAGEVAARGAEGEDGGAGEEVVQRLLLDGIHAEAARPAVGREDDAVSLPGPHEAEALLALVELAVPRAQVALDAAVR